MTDAEKKQLLQNLQTTACDIIRDDTRPFPIQAEGLRRKPVPHRPKASTIPWWLAEIAYEHYSRQYGTSQSLKRLAERGGFGRGELVTDLRPIRRGWVEVEFEPMLDDTRPFPIKGSDIHKSCTIPWWLAAVAWESYRKWPGATLEDMAERGGFTRSEVVRHLRELT